MSRLAALPIQIHEAFVLHILLFTAVQGRRRLTEEDIWPALRGNVYFFKACSFDRQVEQGAGSIILEATVGVTVIICVIAEFMRCRM